MIIIMNCSTPCIGLAVKRVSVVYSLSIEGIRTQGKTTVETTCHWLLISASGQWQFFLQDLAFCARKTNPCQFDVLSLHLSSWVLPSRWYSPSRFCNHPFTHPSVLQQFRGHSGKHVKACLAWCLPWLGVCPHDLVMQQRCGSAHGRTDTKSIHRKHSLMKAMLMQKIPILSGVFALWFCASSF